MGFGKALRFIYHHDFEGLFDTFGLQRVTKTATKWVPLTAGIQRGKKAKEVCSWGL
jgi:hypothetical protein